MRSIERQMDQIRQHREAEDKYDEEIRQGSRSQAQTELMSRLQEARERGVPRIDLSPAEYDLLMESRLPLQDYAHENVVEPHIMFGMMVVARGST